MVSQQYELLMGDSLIVAVMQAHGLTNLASNDADFDRVSWLTVLCTILTFSSLCSFGCCHAHLEIGVGEELSLLKAFQARTTRTRVSGSSAMG